MARDPVQQTTDAVTKLLEYNRKLKGTTTKDSDSEQDWYDRWLESVTLQLQVVKELSDQDLRKLKQRLDYGQEMKKLELEYSKLGQKSMEARLKAATKILDTRIKVQAKYSEKVRSRDERILEEVRDVLRDVGKQDPVVLAFDVWQKPQTGPGQVEKPKILRDDPAWETTFLATMLQVNEKGPAFVLNADNTINIKATRENLNERKLEGLDIDELYDDMNIYNGKRVQTIAVDRQTAVGQQEARSLYAEAVAADKRGDDRLAKQKFEAAQEAMAAMDLNFELKSGIISEAEAQELQDKVDFRRRLQKEAGEIIDYAKNKLGQDGDDKIRSGLAKGVGNSGFRAWAADHGFDRLGRVELDEDGDPIVSTYVEGGDDVAALLAWKKQSMRRPGNYGIKAISSGEIWRVEMKDGTSVTGRRLLRHAADPMGAIRIVTEDGARVITPAEVSQAAILKRPEPKLPRIDKRAQKIHQREKGEYERLDEAVLFQSGALDLDELALSDNNYLQDSDGNYIRSDVRDAAQERARKSILFYASVDGKGYVVDGASGRVFAPGADGKFVEVEGEAAEAVVQGLPPENERVPMLRPAREGDVVGAVEVDVAGQKVPQTIATSADLDSFLKGEFPPRIPSGSEVEAVNALRPQLSSDAALGYTSTPDAPPERVTGEGSNLAGIYVIDSPVGEGPPISDQQELAFDTALDQEVLKQDLEAEGEPDPTGAPKAINQMSLEELISESLTDDSKPVAERQRLANIYNEKFGENYFITYGALKDDDIGFELPEPMYTPPPRKDDKPPAAEQPVAPPPEQPFSPEETGADPVETDPGGTPAFAAGGLGQARVPAAVMAPVTETAAKPGVGKDKQTSLKTVPMSQGGLADAGTMSTDFTSEAGPPRVPDESPDDGGITNVGDVGVPNILSMLKQNRDKNKKGQAESGGGEQTDSVSKDATVKNDEVPGASYGKRKKPDPKAKDKSTTEDEDDGEDNEQAAK